MDKGRVRRVQSRGGWRGGWNWEAKVTKTHSNGVTTTLTHYFYRWDQAYDWAYRQMGIVTASRRMAVTSRNLLLNLGRGPLGDYDADN